MKLTLDNVKKAVPAKLKDSIEQSFVDKLNNLANDPIVADQIRNNFISYAHVINDGKFSIEEYLSAVKYVSFKLMNLTNVDSYARTFPQRYAGLLAKGTSQKDIASYVSAYNRGKLVNLILEQTLVPSWVLNQDIYQKAINTQAELMNNAKSERVKCMAADSILKALAKPEAAGPLVNIDMKESSGINELKQALVELAANQKKSIEKGILTPKNIVEAEIINEQ
ncbi:hypothetical protein [uncultured Methanosphaera sp.]|uniref:hypothetical protein n=1 Tax=uncultured Methanosphaera sp. TaxID=262501 RepID=UPI002593877A|nr:hypothetical protein [uncultured Methanosphaera sp.]